MMNLRVTLLVLVAACLGITAPGVSQEPMGGTYAPWAMGDAYSGGPGAAPAAYGQPAMGPGYGGEYGIAPAYFDGQAMMDGGMGYAGYPPVGGQWYGGEVPYDDVMTPRADGSCENCALGSCQCPNLTRTWGSVEYLAWFSHGRPLPPLVTTSPQGTDVATAGVLGLSTTTVLFGGERVGEDIRSGGRLTLGVWLDEYREIGVAGRFFGVQEENVNFFAASTGNPILAVPFFNATLGQQDALLVAFPNNVNGSVDIRSTTDMIGADALLRILAHRELAQPWLIPPFWYRIDLIGGYHYNRLDDALTINSSLVSVDPMGLVPVGTTIDVSDLFDVRNEFHGGSIGFMAEAERHRLTVQLLGKASFGNMREVVTVRGRQVIAEPNSTPLERDFGLFAQATNSGTQTRNEFAVIPEGNITLNYRLTERLDISLGYSIMYWTSVVLAGNQVDTTINPPAGGNPTGPRPALTFQDTDHWMQGINAGIRWHY